MKRQRESGAAYRKEQVRRLLAESAQQSQCITQFFPSKQQSYLTLPSLQSHHGVSGNHSNASVTHRETLLINSAALDILTFSVPHPSFLVVKRQAL